MIEGDDIMFMEGQITVQCDSEIMHCLVNLKQMVHSQYGPNIWKWA